MSFFCLFCVVVDQPFFNIQSGFKDDYHARIQWGGGGGGVDRVSGPPENHKKYRVFSNTGPDPL